MDLRFPNECLCRQGSLFLYKKLAVVKRIQKQINKFGLTNEELEFVTSLVSMGG